MTSNQLHFEAKPKIVSQRRQSKQGITQTESTAAPVVRRADDDPTHAMSALVAMAAMAASTSHPTPHDRRVTASSAASFERHGHRALRVNNIPRHPHQCARLTRCTRAARSGLGLRAMREDSFDMGSYDPEMDGYEPPEVSIADVTKGSQIGEGSFAVVYAGTVEGVGNAVLKEYRRDVRGRDWFSFYADERAMCRRLVECPGVAPFVGVAGSDLYLVWRDVGKKTLADAMESLPESSGRASALALAAEEMGLDPDATSDADAFVAVARGLIDAVAHVNAANVVHRDVKPDNALLTCAAKGSPNGARVLMVDLGGAADYETGQGTDGSEAIFDPTYGAPEQFRRVRAAGIMGMFSSKKNEGAGELEATGAAPTAAFDAFGVGLTLLRLAVPALHPPGAMKLARSAMDEAAERIQEDGSSGSVLDEWASGPGSESCDFGLLDKLGAWSLVEGLTQWDPTRRMTLEEALSHPSLN